MRSGGPPSLVGFTLQATIVKGLNAMYEAFQSLLLQQPWGMVIMVVLICTAAGILPALIKETGKYPCHRRDTELKRELVERGLSVDEIERIVAAGGPDSGKKPGDTHG